MMRKSLFAVAAVSCLLVPVAAAVWAQDTAPKAIEAVPKGSAQQTKGVQVFGAWARATPGAAKNGAVFLEIPNLGFIIDRSQDKFIPTVRQTEGPSWQDFRNYSRLRLDQTDQRGYDKVYSAKFDLKKDLSLAMPTYYKTGFTAQPGEPGRHNRRLVKDGLIGRWVTGEQPVATIHGEVGGRREAIKRDEPFAVVG